MMEKYGIKEILLALFSGAGTALLFGYAIKKKISKNKVIQKNNKVSGDMAGRDIKK